MEERTKLMSHPTSFTYVTGDANEIEEEDVEDHLLDQKNTVISIVKGIVGAGTFALPWAFLQSGILSGLIGVIVLAILSADTIKLLVRIKRILFPHVPVTYVQLGKLVLGEQVSPLIYIAVVCCSLGVSTAYLDFIVCLCTTLLSISDLVVLLCVLPIIAGLALLRSFKYIAFTAVLGDIAITMGALCVLLYGFRYNGFITWETLEANHGLYLKWYTYPGFLGISSFLFCVHFFILPIEQSMRDPSQFESALDISFMITVILNCSFGCIGYLFFGSDTESIVIDNVRGGPLVTACKLLLCVDMIFSYAIVFAPGRELVEKALIPEMNMGRNNMKITLKRNLVRIGLVALTALVAVSIPMFTVVLSLVGGVSMVSLAFIFPPIMHLRLHYNATKYDEMTRAIAIMQLSEGKRTTIRNVKVEKVEMVEGKENGHVNGNLSKSSSMSKILPPLSSIHSSTRSNSSSTRHSHSSSTYHLSPRHVPSDQHISTLYWKTYGQPASHTTWIYHISIILLGFLIMILTMVTSVTKIIAQWNAPAVKAC